MSAGSAPRHSPFGGQVERRMDDAIAEAAASRLSMRRAYLRLAHELSRDGLPVPSLRTFARRAREARRAPSLRMRPGPQPPSPAQSHSLRHRLPVRLDVERADASPGTPVRYVLVDHALVDVVVLDEDGRELGKPLVTVTAEITIVDGVPVLNARRCEVSVPTGA